jgi:hypothetical protein
MFRSHLNQVLSSETAVSWFRYMYTCTLVNPFSKLKISRKKIAQVHVSDNHVKNEIIPQKSNFYYWTSFSEDGSLELINKSIMVQSAAISVRFLTNVCCSSCLLTFPCNSRRRTAWGELVFSARRQQPSSSLHYIVAARQLSSVRALLLIRMVILHILRVLRLEISVWIS